MSQENVEGSGIELERLEAHDAAGLSE